MTTFLNKNKALALSTISAAILLIFSTIAVCSFCSCAHTKEPARIAPLSQNLAQDQSSRTFKFDEAQDKDRMYTMDIVLYNESGRMEKIYTPIISAPGATCNSN
tara:strand:- start:88 stop:399 length:312 start_codon:yes stop_codon:yes gene_type:complete